MLRSKRIPGAKLLITSGAMCVLVSTNSASAAVGPEAVAAAPTETAIQRPASKTPTQPASGPATGSPQPDEPPEIAKTASSPEATGSAADGVPIPAPQKSAEAISPETPEKSPGAHGGDVSHAKDPVKARPIAETDAIDPGLLGGAEPAEPPRAATSDRIAVEDDGSRSAAIARAYDQRYRPADNPGNLNVVARAQFATAGGNGRVGGRMGGAQVDVGQSWNRVGYAITGSAFGGRVVLDDRIAEMNAMFGLGPTVNLGRAALVGKGFLDLRVGYDFYYSVVNQREQNTVVASEDGNSDVSLGQARNLLPHGPRVQLHIGLLTRNTQKRIHGLGVTLGYQALVGSFKDELPFTHMLSIGLSYWLG